eukprot:s3598_g5.t2
MSLRFCSPASAFSPPLRPFAETMMGTEIRRAPNVNYRREEKSEALQKWIDMDVPAIAVSAVKGFVQHRPVLASFWILGLLIAAFAGGLPVDATSEEAYSHLLQQAELIDSRDLGQRAEVELAKAEAVYYQRKGWFGCDKWCQKAWDKVPGGVEPTDTTAEPSADRRRRRKRHKSTDDLWKEMQQDEMESAKSSEAFNEEEMLQEVCKYCASADGSEVPSAAEMKKKVRFSREALSSMSGAATETKMLKATIVQESVRFAGQTLTIERTLVPGSAEEKRYLQSQKRRNSAKLGGGLAALDKLLGISRDKELNTVEKSGLDWSRHKEEAGLNDLDRDPHAGALERSAFLQRAATRAAGAAKAVQMARAEVKRVQDHRDWVLSEGRREVGIWSSYGVKDIRRSFWSAWQSGKDFASRMTFYDVLFSVGSREESIYVMIFRWILQYLANLTFGLVGAFGFFLYNMYCLIVSYGASLYAVVAGGGVMMMQQAAKHAAVEMNQQATYQRIDAQARPGLHRRRPE